MNIWYILSILPLLIIGATALVRANNIPNEPRYKTRRWRYRKFSLLVAATGALMALFVVFTPERRPFTWLDAWIFIGWAGTWLTSPYMPPWFRFIMGDHRTGRWAGWRQELSALWRSFRAKHEENDCCQERPTDAH